MGRTRIVFVPTQGEAGWVNRPRFLSPGGAAGEAGPQARQPRRQGTQGISQGCRVSEAHELPAEQRVTVKHVHVHSGGQAIVGAVNAIPASGGEGAMKKHDERPHDQRRGWLKNGNPPGDLSAAPRCGARTRRGTSCWCPAMANGRCRLHGGLSTGPKTAAGIERIQRAITKHGRYSKSSNVERVQYRNLLKECRDILTGLSGGQREKSAKRRARSGADQ